MMQPVLINVYNLHWTNRLLSPLGLGFHHTGVQVYGIEHNYYITGSGRAGVYLCEPRTALLGLGYKQTIRLGYTNCSRDEVLTIVEHLSDDEFNGDEYHLLKKNCNHFSEALALLLCGTPLPRWVNRLARVASCLCCVGSTTPPRRTTPAEFMASRQVRH